MGHSSRTNIAISQVNPLALVNLRLHTCRLGDPTVLVTVLRRYQLGEISKEEYDRWRTPSRKPKHKRPATGWMTSALRQNMADSGE